MKKIVSSVIIIVLSVRVSAQVVHLWGVSSAQDRYIYGNIYSINSDGSNFTKVLSFDDTDGSTPLNKPFEASNGKIYGTTSQGGAYGSGTLFNISSVTDSLTVIYNFPGDSAGAVPNSNLIQANNGLIYGMTIGGGDNNNGTIFSFNPGSNTLSTIYKFISEDSGSNPYFQNLMQASNGKLYGLAQFGIYLPISNGNNNGVIFGFDITTGICSYLYYFDNYQNDTDGNYPYGSLVEWTNGKLYGTCGGGGTTNHGTIFSFDTTSNTCKTLYTFIDTIGTDPQQLILYDGKFYGTCVYGGYGGGTIFSFDPTNDSVKRLFNFDGSDGQNPSDLMLASNGIFYGTAANGGFYQSGNIFSFNPENNNFKVIHNFDSTDNFQYFATSGVMEYKTPTGINQLSANNTQFSIYPNPTSGQFTIKLPTNQTNYSVEIYNMVGEKIYQAILNNPQNTIDLNSQPDGMYFVYLKSAEGVKVGKVLVTK